MTRAPVVLGLLCFAASAAAVDHPEVASRLVLKDAGGRAALMWTVKSPSLPLPATSPVTAGANLEVTSQGGESASFTLPASGWTADDTNTTYKFRNRLAPGGPSPVKSATVKGQKLLRVAAKASGITLDESMQGTMRIALTVGADVYCSECTTPMRDQPGRYRATNCAAPVTCSEVTTSSTTSSTSSTTTTTFVSGVCGNGVVDQPSEECDAPDPGVCDDFPAPFPITCDPPSSPTPCKCCGIDQCIIDTSGSSRCCGGAACQDTSGAGMVRGGTCIPPSCTQTADCHGYTCDGGQCCGQAGQFCGVVACCPGSDATCSAVPWAGAFACCRPAGGACAAFNDCCSGSCTGGTCD